MALTALLQQLSESVSAAHQSPESNTQHHHQNTGGRNTGYISSHTCGAAARLLRPCSTASETILLACLACERVRLLASTAAGVSSAGVDIGSAVDGPLDWPEALELRRTVTPPVWLRAESRFAFEPVLAATTSVTLLALRRPGLRACALVAGTDETGVSLLVVPAPSASQRLLCFAPMSVGGRLGSHGVHSGARARSLGSEAASESLFHGEIG